MKPQILLENLVDEANYFCKAMTPSVNGRDRW